MDRIYYDEHSGMNIFTSIFRNYEKSSIFFNFLEEEDAPHFIWRGNFLKTCLPSKDKLGFTPLISACRNSYKSVKAIFEALDKFILPEQKAGLLKELLSQQDNEGFTPLTDACKNSPESVKAIFEALDKFILPEQKADLLKELLSQQDNKGFTPLISACKNSLESVKAIFEALDKSALAEKEKEDFFKRLLMVKIRGENAEFTPLIIACTNDFDKLVEVIFGAIDEFFPKKENKSKCFKLLLEQKDNLKGFTPLISACAKKSNKSIEAIFKAIDKFILEKEKSDFVEVLLKQTNVYNYGPYRNANKEGFEETKETLNKCIKSCLSNKPNVAEAITKKYSNGTKILSKLRDR